MTVGGISKVATMVNALMTFLDYPKVTWFGRSGQEWTPTTYTV